MTLYRMAPSGPDAGTVCQHGLATGGEQKGLASSEGRVASRHLTWHLWAAEAGVPAPKPKDLIQDANGTKWSIDKVGVLTLGTRYRLETTRVAGT